MPVSLFILILYIVALFAISWYAKKRSEGNNENFALAGRRLSAPLICVTIIGLAVGGASTIGVSEHAFRVGDLAHVPRCYADGGKPAAFGEHVGQCGRIAGIPFRGG